MVFEFERDCDARKWLCRNLGWEAATERMLDAGSIEAHEWPGNFSTAQERMLWSMYNSVMGAPPSSPHITSCQSVSQSVISSFPAIKSTVSGCLVPPN